MPAFKDPSFQERTAAAARAKAEALAKLRNKPPVDEAALAARAAARAARDAAAAEKRAAARLAKEEAGAKREAKAKAQPPELTEAERKAARDARYAARKNRKSR